MFHTLAFGSTLAANAVYAQVAGVADGAIPRNQANDYIMPFRGRVIASHVIGATINAAQIQAPSMRTIAYPELSPLNITAKTAIPDMNRYQTYGDNGPQFLANESLGVYASESAAGTPAVAAGIWITDQLTPAPAGQQITLVATSTIVAVDNAWVLGTLTFATQLGAGEYAVTGLDVVADNSVYARLLFPGNSGMRPGVPTRDVDTDVAWKDSFRFGRMGEFGRFVFNAPPQLELLGAAAGSTACRVLLDVVKLRG